MRAESSISSPSGIEILERRFFDSKSPRVEVAQERSSLAIYFPLALGVVFIAHLVLMFLVPMTGDESYYWLWSKHLALGYHDHPPLVGWLIAAATLVSDQAFLIRLPALFCFWTSSLLFYFFARELLSDRNKAGWALLLFLYLPILATSSVVVFTDTPLILSWVLALWAGWKSLRDGRYWLLTGAAVGLAILSKLIGLFLVGSFFLFFLFSPEARRWLRAKVFWGGVLLAVLVSLPVWVWNFRHGFENFVFQAHDHLAIHPSRPFLSFLGYLGFQILCVSPLLFVAFIVAFFDLIRKSLRGDTASRFLLSFALPVHLFFGILPFGARVGVHWAAPGYISLLIACAGGRAAKRWLGPSLAVAMLLTLFFFVGLGFPKEIARLALPLDKTHPSWHIASFLKGKGYGEVLGYQQLSEQVKDRMEKIKGPDSAFLLTDSYTLSSDLAYYTQEQVHTFLPTGQGGEYARWDNFEKLRGYNALWVSLSPFPETPHESVVLRTAFVRVGKPERIEVHDGPVTRSFYFTWLQGLRHPEFLRSPDSDVVGF